MDTNHFKVTNGEKFTIDSIATDFTGDLTKEMSIEKMVGNILDLRVLQDKLYANGRHAVLIIFQAMDAAGKDPLQLTM